MLQEIIKSLFDVKEISQRSEQIQKDIKSLDKLK